MSAIGPSAASLNRFGFSPEKSRSRHVGIICPADQYGDRVAVLLVVVTIILVFVCCVLDSAPYLSIDLLRRQPRIPARSCQHGANKIVAVCKFCEVC
jgi:hypothetical protein